MRRSVAVPDTIRRQISCPAPARSPKIIQTMPTGVFVLHDTFSAVTTSMETSLPSPIQWPDVPNCPGASVELALMILCTDHEGLRVNRAPMMCCTRRCPWSASVCQIRQEELLAKATPLFIDGWFAMACCRPGVDGGRSVRCTRSSPSPSTPPPLPTGRSLVQVQPPLG